MTIINARAFVDWNSQIHAAKPPADQLEEARVTLWYVCKIIGKALSEAEPSLKFMVSLRIYHGWHRGFEATARRKALITSAAGAEFYSLAERANVSIRPVIEFGDNLISALVSRLHCRINCHLPNTLRLSPDRSGTLEEKMVDTAIASDLVDVAHREPETWLLVLGEDDDLVPPVLVAEGVRGGVGGKIIFLRRRPDGPFFKLENIRQSP